MQHLEKKEQQDEGEAALDLTDEEQEAAQVLISTLRIIQDPSANVHPFG